MKINEINVKGIITKSNLPDTDYVINPYIGCQHGCIYCYSKFMKRFTNHHEDWGEFVDIKINASELIKTRGQYRGKRILFSSVTDPYQPLEAKYKLTRKILEKLTDEQPIIEILTKSRLVVRDIDVLRRFENVTVGVSISTLNEKYSRILEPMAALPKLRLESLKKCKDAGIKTYLFVSPIFPYITEIDKIIDLAEEKVDFFMFENLNLRPTNRNKVYDFIRRYEPELFLKYKQIYEEKDNSYWNELREKIEEACKRHGKEARIYFHHNGFKGN